MNESLKAEDIIRQYGLKLTQPRLKVLRLLLSRQEVLTADEIYEALVKEGTSLNFSTVYRTLETFTDEKITEKVQMPQSRKAGFLLFTMSHTHNLICLGAIRSFISMAARFMTLVKTLPKRRILISWAMT